MKEMPLVREDPNAEQEAARYEHPIPSRRMILEHLESAGIPMSRKRICKELGLEKKHERSAMKRRLTAMVRDGQLVVDRRNVYGLARKMDLVTGTVSGSKDGSGTLYPEGGGEALYLDSRQMRALFPGDRIVARIAYLDGEGRTAGEVVEVLERNTTTLVGRFHRERNIALVDPLNRQIDQQILIEPENYGGAAAGQLVVVEITSQPTLHRSAVGRIINVLGDRLQPGMEVEIALQTHNIPVEWPDAAVEEAECFPASVSAGEAAGRRDLRDLPLVTIDGEDARDFDDAVFCERKKGGGWRLYVAIADVSRYVTPGSPLDDEAYNRGTSVYFPRSVVPMLPERLSNGLCSLNPGVDRLAVACEMTISARGRVSGFTFYEAIIRSHARLTYTEVGALLGERPAGEERALSEQVLSRRGELETLLELYRALARVRDERGAIDFDTVETAFQFDESGRVASIEPVERNVAHRIIEECMLCANVCAARFLDAQSLPGLYRVHEGATEEKLHFLRQFLQQFGLTLGGGEAPRPPDYNRVLGSLHGRPGSHAIQMALLRSLSQAVYQPENRGHFGLNYPHYTHFTSPIRRYPDLMVHRAIRGAIRAGLTSKHLERFDAPVTPFEESYPYSPEEMAVIGDHCSMTERRADDSVYDVLGWLKCEFIEQHVGDDFEGVVSGVTGFGLFVELEGVYVEGLVHVSSLTADYYHFDQGTQCLTGERGGRIYGVGDRVTVRVARVDIDERKIDFELISHVPLKGRRRVTSTPKSRRRRGGNERTRGGRRQTGRRRRGRR